MNNDFEKLKKYFADGKNIFITGQAGTGKTFLLNQLISDLQRKNIEIGLAGSTGTAAINIGGTTIHRLLGILNKTNIDEYEYAVDNNMISFLYLRKVFANINSIEVIIIDEISMVGKSLLELMDHVLRTATGIEEVFGGKQVIFSGDFLQLPPVKDKYAFESEIWKKANFSTLTLKEVQRQDNIPFIKILKDLREGSKGESVISFFEERNHEGPIPKDATKLFAKNADVEAANKNLLTSIKGEKKTYVAIVTGNTPSLEKQISKGVQAVEELELKLGAKVMSLTNHEELKYVNGSIGHVTNLSNEGVQVEFINGHTAFLKPYKWDVWEGNKTIATFTQVPLKLAYALTIHKSQGQTIDGEVYVDCAGIIGGGQLYVAISRVKDPTKLKVINFQQTDIKVNHNALDFYGVEIDLPTTN